jgi:hypothetical protein
MQSISTIGLDIAKDCAQRKQAEHMAAPTNTAK